MMNMRRMSLLQILFATVLGSGVVVLQTNAGAGGTVTDASAPVEAGVAGALRTIGAYPQERGVGHTVTALPDGRVFVYGHRPVATPIDAVILDPKLRNAELNSVTPVMWDPKLHGWKAIENPPECQFSAYLHTATALADGRVLIGGGLCDIPRSRDDTRPHVPHTALSLWNDAAQKWESAPELFQARIYHTATLLTDGGVLFVGGESDTRASDKTEPVLDSVELFRDGKISQLPHLHSARAKHTAVRMADGTVLVAGGIVMDGRALAAVEIWDPAKQAWRDAPPLKTPRYGHTAALLSDGRVMISGGISQENMPTASVEIFDPKTNQWSDSAPLLTPLQRHASIVLGNGDVLIVGIGIDRDHPFPQAMLWEKSTGQWRPAGEFSPYRYKGSQSYALAPIPLKNDAVLVFDSASIMQWAPSSGVTGHSAYGGRDGYASILLNDGRIMLAGGNTLMPGGRIGALPLDWVEIYDPATGRFSVTGRLTQPREALSAIVLNDGRAVVASNWPHAPYNVRPASHRFAEIWDPRTGQWSALNTIHFDTPDWLSLEKIGKLNDGRLLFIFSVEFNYRALIWDPRTETTEAKQVSATHRIGAHIAIIPDGRVLFEGGRSGRNMDETRLPEVWDSRTGKVEALPYPPKWFYGGVEPLTLKSGNVLLIDRSSSGNDPKPVVLWDALNGAWRLLPPLPVSEETGIRKPQMIELSDGSLLTETLRLQPGASSWSAVQRFPQAQATLMQLPSGQVIALSLSSPHAAYFNQHAGQWQIQTPAYYLRRKEKPRPVLLELADGRVMVSGNIDTEGWPRETTTQIWDPKSGAWTSTGKLANIYTGVSEAVRLPSGQVVFVGTDRGGNLRCEIGHPADNTWSDCGASMPVKNSPAQFTLTSLQDGRAVLMFGQSEVYAYREQAAQWLPLREDITREPNVIAMSSHAFRLPDGCLISGPPFRISNSTTGKELYPASPVTGIKDSDARMIVLADGTVVVAGYPEGADGMGEGFFHRKASCAGFETQDGDERYMPAISAAASSSMPIAAIATTDSWWQRYVAIIAPYKWLLLAVLMPFVLYRPLRKLVLHFNGGDPTLTMPRNFVIGMRTLFYGIAVLIALALLLPRTSFFRPSEASRTNAATASPCRFIGVWTSTRSGAQYQITLTDDGRYATDPIADGSGSARIHTGTWEIQGDKMIWHHDLVKGEVADINPIRQESDGAFTLIEENGESSRFMRQKKIDSATCSQ
ncbi:MAG: hypothetical protein EPO06_10875 [Burkholderiaceae bacterium]|nr:MAG: hypothetical protein EPO06_10875 [Burkholderiaceae bacterium]